MSIGLAVLLAMTLVGSSGCSGTSNANATGTTQPPAVTSEFGSHISVDARLSGAPRVGSTVELQIDVTSDRPYERGSVTIELPRGLEFADPRAGLEVLSQPSKNPARGGPQARAPVHLDGHTPQALRFSLVARTEPTGELAVFVRAPVTGGTEGGADYIFLGG